MAGQIERIRVFLCVAKHGSFAKASRDLGVSRSITTRYVNELENELGVQLLVRTTRKVSLTAAGQMYFDRTGPLVEELDRSRDLITMQQETLHGELRISVPVSFGQKILPGLLNQFRASYPEVTLKIEMTDRFVDVIDEGYDMALRISGPPSGVSNIWRKIASVPRVLIASPAYLKRAGVPQHPRDLAQHDFLGYSHYAGGAALNLSHTDQDSRLSVPLENSFESNSGDLIVEMARSGSGIALMPKFLVTDDLQHGDLKVLLPDWSAPEIWLTAYYPPYEKMPEKVAVFTSFIEDFVGADPDLLQ